MFIQRAEKVHSLPRKQLIYLSISHVLVTSFLLSLLSLMLANYLDYDVFSKVLIALWSLLLLGGSYILYRAAGREVDLLDYMAGLVFYHRLRLRFKELDMANTVLFLGLFLITYTPFFYTYLSRSNYPTVYAVVSLFLGGVMVALAVSSYVLLEEAG